MTARQRIFIAGLGALLPILILLLTFDPESMGTKIETLSIYNILGWVMRALALFVAGALVGWLNANENRPITVFQIGISAPALLASFVVGSAYKQPENKVSQAQTLSPISMPQKERIETSSITSFFISSAQAQSPVSNITAPQKSPSIMQQIYQGFTGQYAATPIKTLSAAPPQAQVLLVWENASQGNVPAKAFQAGTEKIGKEDLPIYICRAEHMDGVHPGKIRKGLAGCNITFGHHELSIPVYQVLISSASLKWTASLNGAVPENAVVGGKDIPPASEDLYLCRGSYPNENGVHPGKIRKNFGGCSIGWGRHIAIVKQYEVLTE